MSKDTGFENIDAVLVAVKEANTDRDRIMAARAAMRWFEVMNAEIGDRMGELVDGLVAR